VKVRNVEGLLSLFVLLWVRQERGAQAAHNLADAYRPEGVP
jgi:hypothetical protein